MRFLIDGYNLLNQLGLAGRYVGPRGWERSRADLLAWIAKAHGKNVDRVTVIFDAEHAPPNLPAVQTVHGIHVRFAVGRLADDLLEETIQREVTPRQLTVVSSDHRIQEAARRRGCAALDCPAYIDQTIEEAGEPPARHQERGKPASESDEETEHWLREFGTIDRDEELRRFNRPFEDFEKD
jgi:hypothetical protein